MKKYEKKKHGFPDAWMVLWLLDIVHGSTGTVLNLRGVYQEEWGNVPSI
jgi:hypothetical protein